MNVTKKKKTRLFLEHCSTDIENKTDRVLLLVSQLLAGTQHQLMNNTQLLTKSFRLALVFRQETNKETNEYIGERRGGGKRRRGGGGGGKETKL